MNQFEVFLKGVRQWLSSPRFRHLPQLFAAAGIIGMLTLLIWLPQQEARLVRRESEVERELAAIQDDLAEIERLKMRKKPPVDVSVNAIQEPLATSLASIGSSLSIAVVDADHLRVQGSGRFDAIVRWLGDTEQGHRLSTTRMSVVRQKDEVAVDLTMTTRRQ